MRILLVEDEPDLGAAIKQSLNRSNHIVDWAVDGLDAWDFFKLKEYHLGIFDERPTASEGSKVMASHDAGTYVPSDRKALRFCRI